MNADAILKRIEQDARQSAEATMDDARKRAEALSAARREKLSQEDEAAMAQARKDALALDDRLQRMAVLDARKALLAEKRRVLDEAFALALEKMRKMPAARAKEFALRTLLESAQGDETVVADKDSAWLARRVYRGSQQGAGRLRPRRKADPLEREKGAGRRVPADPRRHGSELFLPGRALGAQAGAGG